MTRTATLAALVTLAVTPAFAATYVTSNEAFSGLGDTIGSQFEELMLNSATGTAEGPGTYLVNTVDFTVGPNTTAPEVVSGTLTNTATVDGMAYAYVVPYILTEDTVATIVLGGNTFSTNGYDITINPLTLTSSGGVTSGDLTATVAAEAPEPMSWTLMLVGFGAIGAVSRRGRRGALTA